MIKGVDISKFQANYEIEAGLDFIIVKGSEGRSATEVSVAQIKIARASGLVVGFYHWLHHENIEAQAAFFVNHVKPRAGEFLVCDWEDNKPGGNPQATAEEKDRFIAEVKRLAPQCKVGLYLNPSWDRERNNGRYGDFLWIANYGVSEPRTSADWLIWQYGAPDFDPKFKTDVNYARFASRAAMAAWARGSNDPTPAPITGYKRPALKERVSWRGGKTCTCVIESVEKYIEPRLKEAGVIRHSVDFFQLGYRGDVAASAGTHDEGGVVDVDQDSPTAIRIWREGGWAMWPRVPPAFMYHGHGVLNGCPHLPKAAANQLAEYRDGGDGLRGNTPDSGPRITLPKWWDAIDDYVRSKTPPPAAGGGGAEVPLDPIEELLMTAKFRRIYTDKKRQTAGLPGEWRYLEITDKGNTSFTGGLDDESTEWWGHLNVHLEGLPPGEAAYFRIVEDEVVKGKTKRRVTYKDHNKIPGSTGGVYRSIPIDGVTGENPKDGTVYVRIQWHASVPATITYAEVARRSTGR